MIRKKNIKPILLLASLILAITTVAGGTIAFLLAETTPVVNTFKPTSVPIEVEEKLDESTKKEVTIKNHGEIDAYIRVKVVINWVDGETIMVGDNLPTEEDVLVDKSKKWVKKDEYYYYTEKVPAGEETDYLIGESGYTYPEDAPYDLRVEFLAQSIQAEPASVVEEIWNINPESLKTPDTP